MLVLIVEDEPAMVEALTLSLRFQWSDCRILHSESAERAIEMAGNNPLDLVLLDLGLPDLDGYAVLRHLRRNSMVPVIVISGRQEELDKVRGLELGADDYVTKPFGHLELLARIKAVLRRSAQPAGVADGAASYNDGYLGIDFATRRVTISDAQLYLTPHEYNLLQQLVANAGRTITHEQLLSRVWGPSYGAERGYLRVYLRRLREKIEHNSDDPQYLITDRAVGYRFQPSPFARR